MEREIEWSRESLRQLKSLAKNRHGIDEDIENFTRGFLKRRLPGDPVQGVGSLPVKEHRMQDSSSNKGKSGGFRVYYYYDELRIFVALVFLRRDLPRNLGMRIEQILRDSSLLDN